MRRKELPYRDPIDVAAALRDAPGLAFLDSTGDHGDLGRYAILGLDPFATFAVRNGRAFWNGEALATPPLEALRACLAPFRLEADATGLPFRGGAIGYVAYDFGRRLERLAEPAGHSGLADEIGFHVFDAGLVFDRRDRRLHLVSTGWPEADPARRLNRAGDRLAALEALAARAPSEPDSEAIPSVGPWRSNFTRADFEAAVERVKDAIRAGDIYQANIAQRFAAALPDGFDPFAFYRRLRAVNPAPFGAFLRFGDAVFASSSPERFLRCAGGAVETRPIKGTARRSPDPARDRAAAQALERSEKDRAENVMIVDLLRNDLSRVCRPGSVEVPALCALETYASVHHLTSVVTGTLREGLDGLDLLQACFPGGSITGAPKLRAMDVITGIERTGRGIYCGAIGYLGFDGRLDLSIAIRTVALTRNEAVFQAGGGITLLSDPAAEYRETLAKAQRIFDAFGVPSPGMPAEAQG